MKTAQRLFLGLLFSSCIFSTASAQESPEMQFGVGATVSSELDALHVLYAITPAIHVGTQFGANTTTRAVENGAESTFTGLTVAPYVKGLFFGIPSFKPFVEVQYAYSNFNSTEGGTTTSSPASTLWGSLGAEYFVNKYIGLFGKFRVLSMDLDYVLDDGDNVKFTSFGILDTSVGIEWFF